MAQMTLCMLGQCKPRNKECTMVFREWDSLLLKTIVEPQAGQSMA